MDEKIKNEVLEISTANLGMTITNDDDKKQVDDHVYKIDATIKKVEKYWEEPTANAHATWKGLLAKKAEMLTPLKDARTMWVDKTRKYLTDKENKRKEEQRKLDEARAIAEKEIKDKLEKQAKKAEKTGNLAKLDELIEKMDTVFVPPVIAEQTIQKTTRTESGTATAIKMLTVLVIDKGLVLAEIIAGRLPIEAVTINEAKIKAYLNSSIIFLFWF